MSRFRLPTRPLSRREWVINGLCFSLWIWLLIALGSVALPLLAAFGSAALAPFGF